MSNCPSFQQISRQLLWKKGISAKPEITYNSPIYCGSCDSVARVNKMTISIRRLLAANNFTSKRVLVPLTLQRRPYSQYGLCMEDWKPQSSGQTVSPRVGCFGEISKTGKKKEICRADKFLVPTPPPTT